MRERRLGFRVPYDGLLNSYVADRPIRGLAADLSESGLSLSAVANVAPAVGTTMCVEIVLPHTTDSIWAAATVRNRRHAQIATELGLHFFAMAKADARRLRDYCIESRRDYLGGLLTRIREPISKQSHS